MRKWLLVLGLAAFLCGCAGVRESEFLEHDTLYKDWEHAKFSMWGYKNPTPQTGEESVQQNWWGKEIQWWGKDAPQPGDKN